MRQRLKEARVAAGLTQNQIAAELGITERYYRMIEEGARDGKYEMWDALEDLLGIHQRVLRKLPPDKIVKRHMK